MTLNTICNSYLCFTYPYWKYVLQRDIVLAAAGCGARIVFRFQLCEQTAVVWEAVLLRGCLYLRPGEALPDGSKEAFVALLEYTEEHLKCKQIFVCFKRDVFDRGKAVFFLFNLLAW